MTDQSNNPAARLTDALALIKPWHERPNAKHDTAMAAINMQAEILELRAILASGALQADAGSVSPMCERKTNGIMARDGYKKTGYVLMSDDPRERICVSDQGAVSWFTREQWHWLMHNRDHVEFNWPKPFAAAQAAPIAAPQTIEDLPPKLARLFDIQYRAAFRSGYGAGQMGDEKRLAEVSGNVGSVAEYERMFGTGTAPIAVAGEVVAAKINEIMRNALLNIVCESINAEYTAQEALDAVAALLSTPTELVGACASMNEARKPFAYFQFNEGMRRWDEVYPSSAGRKGVVAAYRSAPVEPAPQPAAECQPCNGMGFVDGVGDICPDCSGEGVQRAADTPAVDERDRFEKWARLFYLLQDSDFSRDAYGTYLREALQGRWVGWMHCANTSDSLHAVKPEYSAGAVDADAGVVDDLAMLVRRLVRALSKAAPASELPAQAVGYLKRKGLQGSPLRDVAQVASIAVQKDWAEDFAHENGKYQNHCSGCESMFLGHKRRVVCKSCAALNSGSAK